MNARCKKLSLRLAFIPAFLTVKGLASSAHAQPDLYSFPDIEESLTKKKETKPRDPFVQALSRKMNVPEKLLTETFEKGFGRMEVLRLILISQKSGKALNDLIKEREKGARLAKIAESAKLNNIEIKRKARTILKELEAEEEKIKLEVARSTPTAQPVAGTEGVLKSTESRTKK